MADTIEQARDDAIRSLIRDLRIDSAEAERWCAAWESLLLGRRARVDRRAARHGHGDVFGGATAGPARAELEGLGRYYSPSRPGVLTRIVHG